MKKITLLFVIAAFITSILKVNADSKTHSVSGFENIKVSGHFKVHLKNAQKENVILKGSNEDLKKIKVEVKGSTLYIEKERGKHLGDIEVFIMYKNLSVVRLSGSCKIDNEGDTIKSKSLKISGSGSSKMTLAIQVQDLDASISGSGHMNFSGTSKTCNIRISGSGHTENLNLKAEDVNIKISGSGKAKISVTKNLSGSISGSGKIYYQGEPAIDVSISGSGKVKKME